MKKVICSYGDEKYKKSLELLKKTAFELGKIDDVYIYNREWLICTEFYKKNKYILDQKRGGGFWLYKPYIILKTFETLENNDVVLFMDAGVSIIDNLNPLFSIMERHPNNGKIIFKLPWAGAKHIAKIWTKRDCFVLTNADEEKYWNAPMTNGAISLWEKNEANKLFLNEWLRYMRDPRVVTDDANLCGKPNFLEFKDHRHDQSVLSILRVKYNFELFRDPTQFGNDFKEEFTNSPYGQLFNHHRGNI